MEENRVGGMGCRKYNINIPIIYQLHSSLAFNLFSFNTIPSSQHWFQIIRTSTFQMYDEQPSRLPYPTHTASASHVPHRFPTLQIRTPMAIFYGGSDSLVDFDVLSADLPELAFVKEIKKWEHLGEARKGRMKRGVGLAISHTTNQHLSFHPFIVILLPAPRFSPPRADFLWGRDIDKLLWLDVVRLLAHFNPGATPVVRPDLRPTPLVAHNLVDGLVNADVVEVVGMARELGKMTGAKEADGGVPDDGASNGGLLVMEAEHETGEDTGTGTEEDWVVDSS
ncbi:hypothetical protein BC936DRAFT_142328 [Jimgerdemannia flammicorona]|uniref:Alpha/Beta hydrolase protein n=1 Tax=Jimgerdemannia flammicorona TaxID=994334 RepID=A0A433A0K2_9FUNG|nr:hypothetical protein BC936DRAFT_142328 [Jimgerdemannia flammicorona]